MKITLTVTCESAEEAAIAVAKLAEAETITRGESGEVTDRHPFTAQTKDSESPASITADGKAEETVVAEETKKPRASKKTKMERIVETLEPKSSEGELTPTPTVDQSTAAPSMDDVRASLQKVMDKHGMPGATSFIQGLGYKRVTEVPQDKFADFIKAAEAKAAA